MGEELDFRNWELLSAYLDGELDDVAAAMLERAVRHDRDLGDALDDLRRQKLALRRWAAALDARPVPPGVRAALDRARHGHETTAGGTGDPPGKE